MEGRRERERQTDRQPDSQTDRQTDRLTDRQTERTMTKDEHVIIIRIKHIHTRPKRKDIQNTKYQKQYFINKMSKQLKASVRNAPKH